MYESYFGLVERPFSIAPDPQYLYMSARHKEAMAHLSYGLSQGGCFIVLTGEVGTGKTTLCRNLLSDLPESVDVALILNANINETELLQTICDELGIDYEESNSQKQLLDLINQYLLSTFAKNRQTVLIIDEAQLLSRDVLEQVRLLTNLETTKHKLLQIILIGQPELSDMLTRNDLRQLAQRVTARYHLGALQSSEIEEYVNFRLGVAGCKQPLFSKQGLSKLHQLSDGIPRKINVLADHALLSAYSQSQRSVDSKNIKQAAGEVFFNSKQEFTKRFTPAKWWWLALAIIALNLALWWYFVAADKNETDKQTDSPAINEPVASEAVSPASDTPVESIPDPVIAQPTDEVDVDLPPNAGMLVDKLESDQPVVPVVEGELTEAGSVVISDEYLDAQGGAVETGQNSNNTQASESLQSLGGAQLKSRENPLRQGDWQSTEFGRILETSADLTGRISAFRNLALLWNVDLPEQIINPSCKVVKSSGLQCVAVDSWRKLMRLNRPSIVVLTHQDQLHRVVVEVVSADAAEVRIGETVYRIPVTELQARWQEAGTLLWRPSEIGSRLWQPGAVDPLLPEIKTYLNRALAQTDLPILGSVNSTVFDLDMSQKVFALQTVFGIASDSKIGNETYLLMNELVSPEAAPLLYQRTR